MSNNDNKLSMKDHIINVAIEEFGNNGYDKSSLNNIRKSGNISKGIIYHYFKDKDDLYLTCVSICFENFTTFLKQNTIKFEDVEKDIKKYIELRQQFFNENQIFANIFSFTLLQPPTHLVKEIKEIRSELDSLNQEYYKQVIDSADLKEGISKEEAVEYFILFQETFNNYFNNKVYDNYKMLIVDHEIKLSKMLKIMLYGIIEEKK